MREDCIACPTTASNLLYYNPMLTLCFHSHVRCMQEQAVNFKSLLQQMGYNKLDYTTWNRKGCLWSASKLVRANLSNAVILRERMRTSSQNNGKISFYHLQVWPKRTSVVLSTDPFFVAIRRHAVYHYQYAQGMLVGDRYLRTNLRSDSTSPKAFLWGPLHIRKQCTNSYPDILGRSTSQCTNSGSILIQLKTCDHYNRGNNWRV